jgi:hypothetical protein
MDEVRSRSCAFMIRVQGFNREIMQTARHSAFISLPTVQIVALAALIATIVACNGSPSNVANTPTPPPQPKFGFIAYTGFVPGVPYGVLGSVSAYTVNTETGTLAPVAGSMLELSRGMPMGIGATTSGNALFVGVGGGIEVFGVSPSDGSLTPVAGSPFSPEMLIPACCAPLAVDAAGRFLLAAGWYGLASTPTYTITTFLVNPSSLALTDVQDTTVPAYASDLKIDSSGGFLYVLYSPGAYGLLKDQMMVFQLSSTGVPTILQSLTPTNCGTGGYLAVDPARRFLYALDFVPDAQGIPRSVVCGFMIDPIAATITQIGTGPLSTVPDVSAITYDIQSRFLFLGRKEGVEVDSISSTGGLSVVAGSPFTFPFAPAKVIEADP